MKSMHIPIPEGLEVPQDGNTKPFKLSGMFVVMGGKLMPLELGGQPVAMPEHEGEEEGEDEEYEGGGGKCDKCGSKGKCEMHGQEEEEDTPKGNSFMVAIERSMKRR